MWSCRCGWNCGAVDVSCRCELVLVDIGAPGVMLRWARSTWRSDSGPLLQVANRSHCYRRMTDALKYRRCCSDGRSSPTADSGDDRWTLCRMTLQERRAQTAGPWNGGDVARWSQNRAPQSPADSSGRCAPTHSTPGIEKGSSPRGDPIPLVTMYAWCLAESVAGFIHPCSIGVNLPGPGLLGLVEEIRRCRCRWVRIRCRIDQIPRWCLVAWYRIEHPIDNVTQTAPLARGDPHLEHMTENAIPALDPPSVHRVTPDLDRVRELSTLATPMPLAGCSDVRLVSFLDRITAPDEPESMYHERPSWNPLTDGLVQLVIPPIRWTSGIRTTQEHRPHQQTHHILELLTHDGHPPAADILNFDHLAPTNH